MGKPKERPNPVYGSILRPGDVRGNCVFGWQEVPEHEFGAYAEAYRRAAATLVRRMRRRRGLNDLDGLVVLFLYRHALELSLKAIARFGLQLATVGSTPSHPKEFTGHALAPLVPHVETAFRVARWPSWDDESMPAICRTRQSFLALVEEFDRLDPQSFAFRYPTKREGGASTPWHTVVNVFDAAKAIDPVLGFLITAGDGLYELLQGACEDQAAVEERG